MPKTRIMDLPDTKDVLHSLAHETLADGRLCMTLERVAYALQINLSTLKDLIAEGQLPVTYIETERGDLRRAPRIPAEALLGWFRSKYPRQIEADTP